MAQTRTLLEITEHTDCDTGMYSIGELDYLIHCADFDAYMKTHGKDGLLLMLAQLIHQVGRRWESLQESNELSARKDR